jgi:hypothetical protein
MRIKLRILYVLEQDILDSLALKVNGQDVALKRGPDESGKPLFAGIIQKSVTALAKGRGEVSEFTFEISHLAPGGNTMLGLAVDWLEIEPLP